MYFTLVQEASDDSGFHTLSQGSVAGGATLWDEVKRNGR